MKEIQYPFYSFTLDDRIINVVTHVRTWVAYSGCASLCRLSERHRCGPATLSLSLSLSRNKPLGHKHFLMSVEYVVVVEVFTFCYELSSVWQYQDHLSKKSDDLSPQFPAVGKSEVMYFQHEFNKCVMS
jgi:hypothetical protein